MKYELNDGVMCIYLEGRIDSTNADKVSSEIDGIVSTSCDNLIFDADNLEYISSAGLRMTLKFRKMFPEMKIINTSSEVYEVFEMTGFTEMMTVEKGYKRLSVDGCKIIGQGAKGIVYRYNEDTIVKVYKNPDSLPVIQNERRLARRAFVLGIPTAISYDIVRVGESYGSVFELLEAKSYSQLILDEPENKDKHIADYANLLKKIHSTEVNADDMPDIKQSILGWVDLIEGELGAENAEKLRSLINSTPDLLTMLHCDYHTNNVMSQNGETLLIDMDTLAHGHPIFELANVYITYVGFGENDPSIVEKFLDLPYDDAKYIWKKFLEVYLDTEADSERFIEVENKAKLIAYTRLMRHTVRRGGTETEDGRKVIAYSKEKICELLNIVDALEF